MEQTNFKATREDVDKLKQGWLHDPCWDIEHTEGFEEFHEELKQFADEQRKIWNKRSEERRKEQAAFMGVEVDSPLFKYLNQLEYRIKELEKQVLGDE